MSPKLGGANRMLMNARIHVKIAALAGPGSDWAQNHRVDRAGWQYGAEAEATQRFATAWFSLVFDCWGHSGSYSVARGGG